MTKEDQTQWNKGEVFDHKDYFSWIHKNNKCCAVCGHHAIEIHHITDIHRIEGKRRDHKRVVPLCKVHHKDSKYAIHVMSKEEFYINIMDLDELLIHSKRLYREYMEEQLEILWSKDEQIN
jgi:hypothetical protein